jgi:hypothetical protein
MQTTFDPSTDTHEPPLGHAAAPRHAHVGVPPHAGGTLTHTDGDGVHPGTPQHPAAQSCPAAQVLVPQRAVVAETAVVQREETQSTMSSAAENVRRPSSARIPIEGQPQPGYCPRH